MRRGPVPRPRTVSYLNGHHTSSSAGAKFRPESTGAHRTRRTKPTQVATYNRYKCVGTRTAFPTGETNSVLVCDCSRGRLEKALGVPSTYTSSACRAADLTRLRAYHQRICQGAKMPLHLPVSFLVASSRQLAPSDERRGIWISLRQVSVILGLCVSPWRRIGIFGRPPIGAKMPTCPKVPIQTMAGELSSSLAPSCG